MEREVRYCTSPDGTRIAYSIEGEGLPFIWIPGWVSHLEIDAQLVQSMGFDEFSSGVLRLGMDKRGGGLSDRDVTDFSLDARSDDVIAVADDAGIDQFAIGGLSEGGPIAITCAARYPDRATRLAIMGSFADGSRIGGTPDMQAALLALIKAEWGMGSKVMAELFTGENSVLDLNAFAAYQRTATDAGNALKILEAAIAIDVRPLLPHIKVPTLVVHARDDVVVPVALGQEIAAGIKGARFVSIPGPHIPAPPEFRQAWSAMMDFVRAGGAAPPPPKSERLESTFRTVLFTDIVGHTQMMSRLGDEKGRQVLREHERITREVLKNNGGAEVKTMGDGFMAAFGSVTKSVECAIALQRAFAEWNESPAARDAQLPIRVGLNAGEPIEEDGDLFGASVILAARIVAKCSGGEILVSDVVRGLCAGKGFLFADRGEQEMRGFEDPVRIYEISWRG
jgi:class 3 adenylate cyclase/pimeloyl-ACP methyl ester carboxylesterase